MTRDAPVVAAARAAARISRNQEICSSHLFMCKLMCFRRKNKRRHVLVLDMPRSFFGEKMPSKSDTTTTTKRKCDEKMSTDKKVVVVKQQLPMPVSSRSDSFVVVV